MALRPEFSLGHSQFNEFLFASVGEEKTGMELTVLSALTRLGFDPWQEAARLSDLPKDAAARALAAAIALLPEGDWKAADAKTIAARLISRLPSRSTPVDAAPQVEPGRAKATKVKTAIVVVAAFVTLLLFAMSYLQVDHTSEPVSGTASSSARPKGP